jgi:hypothetical protein
MAQVNDTSVADVRNDILQHDGESRQRKKSTGLIEIHGPDGQRNTINLSELNEADAQLAAQFGYKPVFKREFGYLSTFSFAVSISGLFSTIMTTFSFPLYAGGSAAAVWCWAISGAGCMCIAVSSSQSELFQSELFFPKRIFLLSQAPTNSWLTCPSSCLLLNWYLLILPPEACEIPRPSKPV